VPHANRESFEQLRPLLFSIAYRMLASVSDAEDVVQDAFIRYERALADGVAVESTRAYLAALVTRLAIDQIRSAHARREKYVGQWLPEPVLTDENDPLVESEHAESISMAFLLLVQRLQPLERAVFLLHDVFNYSHGEIARMLGKTEVHCRQMALRARKRIEAGRPRLQRRAPSRDELARRFFTAMKQGDMDLLMQLVAPGVTVFGDGGGKAPQWSQPIAGRERVTALLVGVGARLMELGGQLEFHEINGQPGALVFDSEHRLINVFGLDVSDGVVHAVRSVINPDKLRHLGPVADIRALLGRRRNEANAKP
jgi:RNA polymerase sigma-70 factor (ECF subfamily)